MKFNSESINIYKPTIYSIYSIFSRISGYFLIIGIIYLNYNFSFNFFSDFELKEKLSDLVLKWADIRGIPSYLVLRYFNLYYRKFIYVFFPFAVGVLFIFFLLLIIHIVIGVFKTLNNNIEVNKNKFRVYKNYIILQIFLIIFLFFIYYIFIISKNIPFSLYYYNFRLNIQIDNINNLSKYSYFSNTRKNLRLIKRFSRELLNNQDFIKINYRCSQKNKIFLFFLNDYNNNSEISLNINNNFLNNNNNFNINSDYAFFFKKFIIRNKILNNYYPSLFYY